MSLITCTVCRQQLEERALLMSENGWICEGCKLDQERDALKPRTSPLLAAGYAVGLVPFCFSITINNISLVALGAGVIGLLLGVGAMASTLTRGAVGESKGKRLVVAAGVIALAVWNILRGLGKLIPS